MGKRKVELELVAKVLQKNKLNVRKTSKILEDLHNEIENETVEKAKPIKKQFVILASKKKEAGCRVGWALAIPEDLSPHVVEERVIEAAHDFNMTPKGRKLPVRTIGEAIESVPARILREQDIYRKHKEPVYIFLTNNKIST